MPSYPGSYSPFINRTDGVDIVDAGDPNQIYSETLAIEQTLGLNPQVSTTPSSGGTFDGTSFTYSSLSARLANIETGVVSDAHNQYVHKSGGDTITGNLTVDGILETQNAADTGNYQVITQGDSATNIQPTSFTGNSNGTGLTFALGNHVHAVSGGILGTVGQTSTISNPTTLVGAAPNTWIVAGSGGAWGSGSTEFTVPYSGNFKITLSADMQNTASTSATVHLSYFIFDVTASSNILAQGDIQGLVVMGTRVNASKVFVAQGIPAGHTILVTPYLLYSTYSTSTFNISLGNLVVEAA